MAASRSGRPLSALALFVGSWVAMRIIVLSVHATPESFPRNGVPRSGASWTKPTATETEGSRRTLRIPPTLQPVIDAQAHAGGAATHGGTFTPPPAALPDARPATRTTAWFSPSLSAEPQSAEDTAMEARIAGAFRHHMLYISGQMLSPARRAAGSSGSPGLLSPPARPAGNSITAASANRWQFSAYSFVRGGDARPGLADNASYGGSQAALIARFALDRDRPERWQLAVRSSRGFARNDPFEQAAGMRWQPSAKLPVAIYGEYRFRDGARDGPALFVAGGIGPAPLANGFRLEAYGQAGVAQSGKARAFFDASAQATRPLLVRRDTAELSAGVGIWAGGQESAARLDLGPVLLMDVPVAQSRFRLSAAWRERVAGQARPGSGPSLTLSTDF